MLANKIARLNFVASTSAKSTQWNHADASRIRYRDRYKDRIPDQNLEGGYYGQSEDTSGPLKKQQTGGGYLQNGFRTRSRFESNPMTNTCIPQR